VLNKGLWVGKAQSKRLRVTEWFTWYEGTQKGRTSFWADTDQPPMTSALGVERGTPISQAQSKTKS